MFQAFGDKADHLHGGQVEWAHDLGIAMAAGEILDSREQKIDGLIIGGIEKAETGPRPTCIACVGLQMAVSCGAGHRFAVAFDDAKVPVGYLPSSAGFAQHQGAGTRSERMGDT